MHKSALHFLSDDGIHMALAKANNTSPDIIYVSWATCNGILSYDENTLLKSLADCVKTTVRNDL